MIIGLLLLAAAMALSAYNLINDRNAGISAEEALSDLKTHIEIPEQIQDENSEFLSENDIPVYILNPEMEMPVVELNGNYYIGILTIPALELELPIMSEWDYPGLQKTPCRYYGSAYNGSLVIAGHNYDRHFGRLKTLSVGEFVSFTDAEGNVFNYEVGALETLKNTESEEMKTGDWDLTLFTCTIGGQYRVTLRCYRVD